MKKKVWQVFVPHLLLSQESSLLFGEVSYTTQSVYITASCPLPIHKSIPQSEIQYIGCWTDGSCIRHRRSKLCDPYVDLSMDYDGHLDCKVKEKRIFHECTIIVYDPHDLLKSEIFSKKLLNQHNVSEKPTSDGLNYGGNNSLTIDKDKTDVVNSIDEQGKHGMQTDTLMSLLNVLNSTNEMFRDIQDSNLTLYSVLHKKNNCLGPRLLSTVIMFVTLLHLPFKWMKHDTSKGQSKKGIIVKTICSLSTYAQLSSRQQMLLQLRQYHLKPGEKLRVMNILAIQFIDTLCGLILMYILTTDNTAQYVANVGLAYGDHIANELKVLLDWLMGSPAGLKLNSQLTHILGKFFLYHIYLWSGYLVILKPILRHLLYYCSMAGIWGLSTQLALFQDILSTMTIHIYCFYVYAARLYRLQMYALGSLWRLFRGKKWNVLRERVDSAVYDVDQLFVGTLLFTVLLFILPTTGLYYVVFTLLRVFVLLMQGTVSRLRHYFNSSPWWYIIMWIIKSPSITNGAVFHFKSYDSDSDDSSLVLTMQATRPGLKEIMGFSESTRSLSYSWGTIIKNLFNGDLIYPWIERKQGAH